MSDRIDELLTTKGLPSYPEAERIILGTAQYHPEAFDDLVRYGSVRCYEFFLESHQILLRWYEQIRAKGMPLTLETICDGRTELEIEKIGGKSYICKLLDYATSPDTLPFYAEKIREKADLRALIHTSRLAMLRALEDDESAQTIIEASHHEIDVLREKATQASTGRKRNIFHADDRKAHIKPARVVIEDFAYRGQVTAVAGMAGCGKTHVLVDLAATAAQFCKVLLITNEASDEIDAQLDAFGAFRGCELPGLAILDDVAGLFDPSRVAAIISTAHALGGYDVILHDILSNEFEGREETNENMAVAFSAAKLIARECDCAYILSAHTGWLGEHIRGGSQSYGSARRVFIVENSDEVLTLKVVKANVKRGMDARRFRILQIPWERVTNGDETRAAEYTVIVPADRVVDDGPISARQAELLRCLALPVFAAVGATPAEIRDQTGQKKSTCNNAASVLMKRGLIDRAKHKLVLTGAGLACLQTLDNELAADQNINQNTTELGTNAAPFNWSIAFDSVRNITPVVRDGSYPVRTPFVVTGSEVRSYPLPYRGYNDRTNEREETDSYTSNEGTGPDYPLLREGEYDLDGFYYQQLGVARDS